MSIKKTLSLILCLCMVAGMFGGITVVSAASAAYGEDFNSLAAGDLASGTALDDFAAVSLNMNMLRSTASTSSLKVVQDSEDAANKYLEWSSELVNKTETNKNPQVGVGLRFQFPKSVDLSKADVTVAFKVNYNSGTKFRGIHYGENGEACTGFTHDSCHRAGMSYHENGKEADTWYDVELTYEKTSSTEANCIYKFKKTTDTTWTTRTGDLTTGSVANGNSPKLGTSDNVDFLELTIYNNTEEVTTNPVVLIDDLTFSQGKITATTSTSYFEDFTNVNTATGLDSLALTSFGLVDFNELIEKNNTNNTVTRSIDVVEASGNKYLKWTSNITNTNTQNNGVGIRFHFPDMINLQAAPVTAAFKLYVESFNAVGWRALHFGDSDDTACSEFTHSSCGCHRTGLAYSSSSRFATGKWYDVEITYDITKTIDTDGVITKYKESTASSWTTLATENTNVKTNADIDCMELTIYRNAIGSGDTVIYLDDISFSQTILPSSIDFAKDYTTATAISEITVGTKKTAEAANDTYTADTTGSTTTAALDGTNGLKWTVKQAEAGSKGVFTYLDVDVENFSVTNKPIEIQFTVKLFDDYRRPYNFPALVGSDGVGHKMGLGSATPSSTQNHLLEQALFRGTYILGINYGKADSMKLNGANQQKETTSYHNAMGAYYTFKYVIDPVTDTYRYYSKAADTAEFNEPYAGMPGYPVELDSMPSVLDSIRFCVAGTSAGCTTEGHMYFKDVSVKTLDAVDTVTGRITGRTYANVDTENVSSSYGTTADATVTYQVTYTDTSLADTATKSGTVIAVAYNSQGTGDTERTEPASVKEVKLLGSATLTNGIPAEYTATFNDVPVRYDADTSAVTKDGCIYALYIWDSMTGLTPLSVGDMWISNDNGTK